jgi:tetratricopeptide (TPR) repeat protein
MRFASYLIRMHKIKWRVTVAAVLYIYSECCFSRESIRMTTGHFRQIAIYLAVCVLVPLVAIANAGAQKQEPASAVARIGSVQGHVRNAIGQPVANAPVSLHLPGISMATVGIPWLPIQITHTDPQGAYQFPAVEEGEYVLLGGIAGTITAFGGPVRITPNETKTIDFAVPVNRTDEPKSAVPASPATGKPVVSVPQFFDEPQFTVAGVTQATNSGGHGSDTVLRTTEALAKATVSLSKESPGSSSAATSTATESSLRDAVAREKEEFDANRRLGKLLADSGKAAEGVRYLERASQLNPKDPELHHLLGDVEEKLGNPLEAVREYQRAAELDPSEPYLFDWGTELLIHRALEPATEVFTKGNRLFPKSVRMLVALGVAWYSRGSYDQAAQCLVNASDLAPDNPTPYLFLGKMQSVETTPSEGSVERLGRFAQLQPDNALATYYYAVSLWKQSASVVDTGRDSGHEKERENERSARVESLLQKAVHLDPKLGAAYLQLGILYSQRADFPRAISAYQKAIEVSLEEVSPEQVTPEINETLEVAYYRLAQAYLRTGDKTRAQEQLQLHDQLAKKTKENIERERYEIKQFVISLQNKNKNSVSPPQP